MRFGLSTGRAVLALGLLLLLLLTGPCIVLTLKESYQYAKDREYFQTHYGQVYSRGANFKWWSVQFYENLDEHQVVAGLQFLKERDAPNWALGLSNCSVNNDAAEILGTMIHVNELNLSGTNIQDQHIAHLANMQDLVRLNLMDTPLTDDGIVWLSQLEKLEWLLVRGTNVTDEGLDHLASLQRLTQFAPSDHMTDEAIERFKAGIPEVRIVLGRANSSNTTGR